MLEFSAYYLTGGMLFLCMVLVYRVVVLNKTIAPELDDEEVAPLWFVFGFMILLWPLCMWFFYQEGTDEHDGE